jgi:hypothetical protein
MAAVSKSRGTDGRKIVDTAGTTIAPATAHAPERMNVLREIIRETDMQ